MAFDTDKAVKHALDNAEAESAGLCATYVRQALEAGGLDLSHHPLSAKDYGPTLEAAGFVQIYEFKEIPATPEAKAPAAEPPVDPNERACAMTGVGAWASLLRWSEFDGVVKIPLAQPAKDSNVKPYVPEKGDVVVIQPYKGGSQHGHIALYTGTLWVSDFKQRDMWGGPGYRKAKPPSVVYRPK